MPHNQFHSNGFSLIFQDLEKLVEENQGDFQKNEECHSELEEKLIIGKMLMKKAVSRLGTKAKMPFSKWRINYEIQNCKTIKPSE
ncbi:MAG: hypothetical protein J5930_09865 [Treponema sp.]|nr:hypothetical protein [Treponema sp.]